MKKIYLDHAAATTLSKEVFKIMIPYYNSANPSSLHSEGRKAWRIVEKCRLRVAQILSVKYEHIIFTSGGTESINLALQGVKKGHIITSKIEHPAVLETCRFLETQGYKVTYLDVDKAGLINVENLAKAIKKNTVLISIMYANNEIGTIQPVKNIVKIARKHKVPFHTDACQAGSLDLDIKTELMTLNGGKIYGPKGIGILYSKIKLKPLIYGGGQEFGLRSGTENVSAIVGFTKALELNQKNKKKENKRLIKLKDYLIKELLKIPNTKLNGHPTRRLPNNINISFKGIDHQQMLEYLSQFGIYCSTGSACNSKKIQLSHVLKAIGVNEGSLRFSLGKDTTKNDLKYVVRKCKEIVKSLRML